MLAIDLPGYARVRSATPCYYIPKNHTTAELLSPVIIESAKISLASINRDGRPKGRVCRATWASKSGAI